MNGIFKFEHRDGRLAIVEAREPHRHEWITVDVSEPSDGETCVAVTLVEADASHLLATGDRDSATLRERMTGSLNVNYRLSFWPDVDDAEARSLASELADRFAKEFLNGDFTPFGCCTYVRWFSRDCLNTIALGDWYSLWDAERDLPHVLAYLLDECANDEQRRIILDGHFYLVRQVELWEDRYGPPVIVEASTLLPIDIREAA